MDKLLATYSLLGYLKETSSSKAAISELYIPLVKKALSQYASEHGLLEYKGRSLKEISDKVFSIFDIRIPLPILGKILEASAMSRGADREREAADQGDAAVEAHQLHRDLALVMIHGQHGIEIAVLGAQEDGV